MGKMSQKVTKKAKHTDSHSDDTDELSITSLEEECPPDQKKFTPAEKPQISKRKDRQVIPNIGKVSLRKRGRRTTEK